MHRIERDQRHLRVTRLHEGFVETSQFQTLGVGYWYVEDKSRVMQLRELHGHGAKDELRQGRAERDVES